MRPQLQLALERIRIARGLPEPKLDLGDDWDLPVRCSTYMTNSPFSQVCICSRCAPPAEATKPSGQRDRIADREAERISFRREHAKNAEPRVIPFVASIAEIIARRWKARQYKGPGGPGVADRVFHRNGQPVVDFPYGRHTVHVVAPGYRPWAAQFVADGSFPVRLRTEHTRE